MPSYTLYYFNGRGRAEICRMMFSAAGVQYNDKRINVSEWNKYRDNCPISVIFREMPVNMLPVLEIDGTTKIPQSMTIARYLAREFQFHGKNSTDMAIVDYICDCFYDIVHDYIIMYHDNDGRLMASMGSDMCSRRGKKTCEGRQRYSDTCSRALPFLEKTLEMQGGGDKFFMGDELTVADMMCHCALETPLSEQPTLLDYYPKLQGLRTRVRGHSMISAYLKKRRTTEW